MRTDLITRVAVGMSAAMLALPAHAQTSGTRGLQPVEPMVGDLGPLGVSQKILPRDMRQPTGFDRVYRVPGAATGVAVAPGLATAQGDAKFARKSGAITAVFGRSEYYRTDDGIATAIPAGTVYYIGKMPEPVGTGATAAPAMWASNAIPTTPRAMGQTDGGLRMTMRADLRVLPEDDAAPVEPAKAMPVRWSTPAANVLADDGYRRTRVRELLMAAVRGE